MCGGNALSREMTRFAALPSTGAGNSFVCRRKRCSRSPIPGATESPVSTRRVWRRDAVSESTRTRLDRRAPLLCLRPGTNRPRRPRPRFGPRTRCDSSLDRLSSTFAIVLIENWKNWRQRKIPHFPREDQRLLIGLYNSGRILLRFFLKSKKLFVRCVYCRKMQFINVSIECDLKFIRNVKLEDIFLTWLNILRD